MNYKNMIIELLETADERCLKLIYTFVKSLLGL